MFAVTGSTGHLGRHVVAQLLEKVPAGQIVALARDPARAQDLAARGVQVRQADYGRPETLRAALTGVERLLLISGSQVGQRLAQHQAVIATARTAGVRRLLYTSILRADTNRMTLAGEHRATEEAITAAGIPHVFLRNGWYLENYTERLAPVLQHGAVIGSAGQGRIAAAARADYAAAAVAALTAAAPAPVYELAGDQPFTMAEYAAEVARQTGKPIAYRDLPPAEYQAALVAAGLPPAAAGIYADADAWVAQGALDDGSHTLSRLIGRPTTPLAAAVKAALAG